MKTIKSVKIPETVQEKFNLLSQVFFQKPGDIKRDAFDQLADDFMKFDGSFLFPAGEYAPYVYDFDSESFIRMGKQIETMLGISPEEVMRLSSAAFFSEFLYAGHVTSVIAFTDVLYEFLLDGADKERMVMMEVNMETRRKETKRILLQFKPAIYDDEGKPVATWGVFADITPIKKDGPPQLICMENGKLVSIEKGKMAGNQDTEFLSLNKQDLTILDLRGKGLQVKEIAEQTGLQPSTVFSYLRDIRRKTGMDIIPLIQQLTDKGILALGLVMHVQLEAGVLIY